MDQTAIVCIEEAMHLGLNINVEASLIIETDGSDEQTVTTEIEACARICKETGAQTVKFAQNEMERRQPVEGTSVDISISGAQSPE